MRSDGCQLPARVGGSLTCRKGQAALVRTLSGVRSEYLGAAGAASRAASRGVTNRYVPDIRGNRNHASLNEVGSCGDRGQGTRPRRHSLSPGFGASVEALRKLRGRVYRGGVRKMRKWLLLAAGLIAA